MLQLTLLCAIGYSIVYPGVVWEKATGDEVGMNTTALSQSLSQLPGGIFVTRYGKEVWERDPTESGKIWSISKSIVAMAYSNILSSGKQLPQSVPYSDSPAAADAAYNVQWFSSGDPDPGTPGKFYTFDEIFSMRSLFGLKPLPHNTPSCAYNNNGIQLAGYALLHSFGNTTKELKLPGLLFDQVGSQDDIGFHGQMSGYQGGYLISARDLTRLGLLILSNGTWKGQQVLDKRWVAQAITSQVPATTVPNTDQSNDKLWNEYDLSQSLPYNTSGHPRMSGDVGYGYTFWLLPNTSAVHMSGLYGNYVIIDFEYGLVISVTNNQSQHPGASDYHSAVVRAIVRK